MRESNFPSHERYLSQPNPYNHHRLKILQIIDQLNVGGAEKMVVTLANLLYERGHEIQVVSLLGSGLLDKQLKPGVRLVHLHRSWKWHPVYMYKLVRICRRFDIVHVHSAHNLRYVFLASRLFKLNKPLFFHEHFGDIEFNRSVSWHQRLIYPKVHTIAVSRQIVEWARTQVGVPDSKIHLLPNFQHIQTHESRPQANGKVNLVAVSNFRPTKNLEFLLHFFQQFSARHPATLTIIGQISDPSYCNHIQQIATELKLLDSISFIHDCTDVQPLLGQFDLALHPSRSESGPLVLIEYLGHGLPFLSYRTGEISQMLAEAFPDCVLQDFEVDNWVHAASSLLSSPRSEFQKRATPFYHTHFSEEQWVSQCLHIYRLGLAC